MSKNEKQVYLQCKACRCFVPFDYEDWCPYCGKVILFRRKEDYISQDSKTYFFSTLTEKNQFIIENWLKCCETLAKYRSDSINISEMKLLKEKTIEYKEILLRCKDLQIYPGSFERIYLEHEGSIYLYFPYLTDNKNLSF
jgi:DNA-directed RNA polymerase beta' subunit